MLIKYRKSVFWRVAKCLSYIEDAWCLKVKYVTVCVLAILHRYRANCYMSQGWRNVDE